MRVVEQSSSRHRILIAAICAFIEVSYLSRFAFCGEPHDTPRIAALPDTTEPIRPPNLLQVTDAEILTAEFAQPLE
jgi:hypothetical protein